MAKLNVDQTTIKGLFDDKKTDFLIPDYQRPYAWKEKECETLWEDIFEFAIPEKDYTKFEDETAEYYLGPIVSYKNKKGKMEIIDGQQRLTTLMLLLRAFYERFGDMKDPKSVKTRENLARCIWKTDEFGNPNLNALKINSEVATDNDKVEFLSILKFGNASKEMKSKYAENYRLFQRKIDEFLKSYPSFFAYLPTRILNNCILLPIEAESQDTALRIFSTLNDRGLPLSDADIFKAQFYKYYSAKNQKEYFIEKWKSLEDVCEKIFRSSTDKPMDEIFTRYMYYERAKQGVKASTTEALRKFYERDNYKLLKNDYTLNNLILLADFWNDVINQNVERFADNVLKKLFVLNYAPNGMWTYFVSVYFMQNKDTNGLLDDVKFYKFLDKTIAFIWTYALTRPGVNALRTPIYAEMLNIVESKPVEFVEFKFEATMIKNLFDNFIFSNGRPITKSMLAWWAFANNSQELLSLENVFEIEHIYARNRQDIEKGLKNITNLEALGNKSLLEERINIRAADYRFVDKVRYYSGYTNGRGQKKQGTNVSELRELAVSAQDFTEKDIEMRNTLIINSFIDYLEANQLLK